MLRFCTILVKTFPIAVASSQQDVSVNLVYGEKRFWRARGVAHNTIQT
jgi:hypothetical protein